MMLTPEQVEALKPALDNEIDTWAGADCGEHQAENDRWVEQLRGIRAMLESDPGSPLPEPPEKIADAWRRFQAGEHVEHYEARAIDEWRSMCAEDAGF
jgi:hypothetical protein